MRATFAGLEIARRSLLTQRQALDVTGHNIANANTPGYSRQVAQMTATRPFSPPTFSSPTTAGQMGTGVQVQQVKRMTDSFVQFQINQESRQAGYWEKRMQILEELELTFLEPSQVGIRHALDAFWESLQDLSLNPESQSTRVVVRERALLLTENIRSTYDRLEPLRQQLDSKLRSNTARINSLAERIASLNREIVAVKVKGDQPNDLMDARDALVEELANLVDITVAERPRGDIAVSIGGVSLVDGSTTRRIIAQRTGDEGFVELRWEGLESLVTVRSGEMAALLEGRDVIIPNYMDELNQFARTFIQAFNEVHRQGYGLHDVFDPNDYDPSDPNQTPPQPPGRNFFKDLSDEDPTYLDNAAKVIALDDSILADAANIAASRNGSEGDGGNAQRLAEVMNARIYHDGAATPNEFLGSLVSGLGVQTEKARQMMEHQETVMGYLERMRSSVSGVSLDEEMTNLIMFQHAYTAASRLATVMDEAIDVIIHRMGLVGR